MTYECPGCRFAADGWPDMKDHVLSVHGQVLEDEPECRCPHLRLDDKVLEQRAWSDRCPRHGVGTENFRSRVLLPFGYATERDTTREEWLAFLANTGWEELDDEPGDA